MYANGARSGSGANPILVGPRGGRGGAVMGNAVANPAAIGNPNAVNIGNGRRGNLYNTGNVAAPGGNVLTNAAGQMTTAPQAGGRGAGRNYTFGGGQMAGQPAATTPGTAPAASSMQPAQGQMGGRRGFFGSIFGGGNTNAGGVSGGDQQMQRRSYSQPNYNQPSRSYSQPQPSYSQPSRSFEQRSFSQPAPSRSFGGGSFGGGGGGGNFGGGGGGGRRGR